MKLLALICLLLAIASSRIFPNGHHEYRVSSHLEDQDDPNHNCEECGCGCKGDCPHCKKNRSWISDDSWTIFIYSILGYFKKIVGYLNFMKSLCRYKYKQKILGSYKVILWLLKSE